VPLAGTLLAIGCMAYVALPLYAARRTHHSAYSRSRLHLVLMERKEALYAAIVEIEFDRDVGKVPEEDYQRQRQALESEVLEILAELEGLEAGGEEAALRARIGRDVAGLQSQVQESKVQESRARQIQRPDDATPTRCPSCQAAVTDQFRFCPECGAALGDTSAGDAPA